MVNGTGRSPEPGSDACVPDHQENLPHAGGAVLGRPDLGLHPGQRLRVCGERTAQGQDVAMLGHYVSDPEMSGEGAGTTET